MVEQAASVVAADNVELACCFVQKTAVERALIEMDKRLNNVRDGAGACVWKECGIFVLQ